MEVLILSKTQFGFDSVCIGGMVLSNFQYVRLLRNNGCYQTADTGLNVGDIWDMKFIQCTHCREPHNEDVLVQSQHYLKHISNITRVIVESHTTIWHGSMDNIFESKLHWTQSGVGYLSVDHHDYPSHSVGFWISDKPLTLEENHYWYPTGNDFISRKIRYKGVAKPVEVIPVNTLIRVSMAKWWKPEKSKLEERCYAQLSGWYEPIEVEELCE